MKAMVFAAGLGTRLRPLTDRAPKALIEVGGVPMLGLVLRRLAAAGVTEAVVNAHHFHEKIADYLSAGGFGLKTRLSLEEERPLETGGGLKKAAPFFSGGEPFFAYNSDVWSETNLKALYSAHLSSGALATLVVRDRPSRRRLLFDGKLRLVGREGDAVASGGRALAFSGVQVISPEIFAEMTEEGVFSVTDVYLRLAASGRKINGFIDESPFWSDVGDLERLEAVRLRAAAGEGR